MTNALMLRYLQIYTFLVIKGPCTTVTDVQLGDRFTSASFKWLFMLNLNRGGREGGALSSLVQVCVQVFF